MSTFKNIAKGLAATINITRLISKKNINLINPVTLCAGLFCLLSVTIFSCTKDHSSPTSASLMIVQGADSAPQDGITLDKKQITTPFQPLKYGAYTDYLNTFSGNHVVTVSEYGPNAQTDITATMDTLFLNTNNSYSLFLSSTYNATTDNVSTNDYPGTGVATLNTKFTLLVDSLSRPATGQAKIRFVNVSPNTGSVDLLMDGNVVASNKSSGGYSLFIPVNSTTSSDFEVLANGSSAILSTLKNVEIKSGGIYTIWLYGPASDSQGTGLKLGMITNKQY